MKNRDTSLIVRMVRFAGIMLIVGLVVGLFYREYSKKFLFTYPLQTQLSVGHYLSLAHGHTFLLGMVLPLVLAVVIVLLRDIHTGGDDLFGVLQRVFTFYMIGAVASLLLLYYKGTALIYLFHKDPALPLMMLDKQLFFGSDLLRLVLYFFSHALLGGALVYAAIVMFARIGSASRGR